MKTRQIISNKERLIFALDTNNIKHAKSLVDTLADSVCFYKLGLELLTSGNYFQLLDWLFAKNKKVFIDLKLFDIPQTIAKTVAGLAETGASFITVHGNEKMLASAVENKKNLKILAVTALTSLDENDLKDLGFACDVESLIVSRAKRALSCGCDGIVSSGLEVPMIRQEFADKLLVVTPGIRPIINNDDQKRTVDIKKALDFGVDYLVVGRPIALADDPYKVASNMQEIIATYCTN